MLRILNTVFNYSSLYYVNNEQTTITGLNEAHGSDVCSLYRRDLVSELTLEMVAWLRVLISGSSPMTRLVARFAGRLAIIF